MTTIAGEAWAGTRRWQDARPGHTWAGDNTREYTADEREAMALAADWARRVWVPGDDPEPAWSAELIDRDGVLWRKIQEGVRGDGGAWSPEGCPELHLKWSAPAMRAAGPFIGPRRRTADEIAEQKRRASNTRWARERERSDRPAA